MNSLKQYFERVNISEGWFILVVVTIVSLTITFYQLGAWPWDHDEVASLVELGVLQTDFAQGKFGEQLKHLPQLVPVWYFVQRLFLLWLPVDEFGTRVLSALCGSLTIVLAYIFARLWRGIWFATALALLLGLNQCFVWLVQQNRFYSMALLFLVFALATIWMRTGRNFVTIALCVMSTLLAVLSHNLTAVVFWIGGIAAVVCLLLQLIPKEVGVKAIIAAAVACLTHVFYLRPLMKSWISGSTGGTNELVSFAAQLGIPTIAFAGLGIAWSLRTILKIDGLAWWFLVLLGGVAFIGLSPFLMNNWNPRYALFLMLPFWVFAAYAVEQVAISCLGNWRRGAWYGCIALLLMPKLLSHYCDGSRHDFRTAAQKIAAQAEEAYTIYTDWPLELEYYLRQYGSFRVQLWGRGVKDSLSPAYVVLASNAFVSLLNVPGYKCDLIEQIVTRRFDEQTHTIRIYKITLQ